jgi:hypothetical protein
MYIQAFKPKESFRIIALAYLPPLFFANLKKIILQAIAQF